jgi:chaperonin cofactor prefoldin
MSNNKELEERIEKLEMLVEVLEEAFRELESNLNQKIKKLENKLIMSQWKA